MNQELWVLWWSHAESIVLALGLPRKRLKAALRSFASTEQCESGFPRRDEAHRDLTCVVVRLPDVLPAVLGPAQRNREQQEAQQVFPTDLPHHEDDDDGEICWLHRSMKANKTLPPVTWMCWVGELGANASRDRLTRFDAAFRFLAVPLWRWAGPSVYLTARRAVCDQIKTPPTYDVLPTCLHASIVPPATMDVLKNRHQTLVRGPILARSEVWSQLTRCYYAEHATANMKFHNVLLVFRLINQVTTSITLYYYNDYSTLVDWFFFCFFFCCF